MTPRDFTEPRTLSADRVARIRKSLSARLQAIANALAGPLRGHPVLSLGEVSEVNAAGLFDGFVRPFLVHGFLSAGQQGWVIWRPPPPAPPATRFSPARRRPRPPKAAATKTARTARAPPRPRPPRPRRKSPRSSSAAPSAASSRASWDIVAGRLGAELGIEVDSGIVWQEPEDLTTLEDLGPDADSRRLFVHLTFADATGTTSDLRVYLPGLVTPTTRTGATDPLTPRATSPRSTWACPSTWEAATFRCRSSWTSRSATSSLEARVGDLVEVEIEETTCARGRFGAHDGRLAVLLTEVGVLPPAAEPT